jgi:endonuclease/exonuclease/phosphatase family metal-dependent hydrolase
VKLLRKLFVKFFFLLNFLAALYALLVFQVAYSADIKHWIGGFLSLTVQLALLINFVFLLFYIFSGSWKFLLSLVVFIAGYRIMERTFKVRVFSEETRLAENQISMLSYNVMYIGDGSAPFTEDKTLKIKLADDVVNLEADIKCLQELNNVPGDTKLNMIKRLSEQNPYYTYMHSEIDKNSMNGAVGLAIFSKYPIIDKEEVSWKINNNGLLRVDIKAGEDTIRVFNIQMKSMGIRVQKALTRNEHERTKETRNILSQLKIGFEDRTLQVDQLVEMITESPYPVLLAGDFNEVPYGYAYGRVRKMLSNSFEKKGLGFGFTYHKLPSFIRIDNLFFDQKKFKVLDFDTLRDYKLSDHYPIRAVYEIIG